MKFKTFSNGKILFTSEYFVLKGSLSLAIPTKYGQSFSFSENDSGFINWKSFSSNGKLWFQCKLKKDNLKCITTSNHDLSNTLTSILKSARQLNQSFFSNILGGNVITKLDFPISWGLGSSSTLINNISKWAKVDPFELLWSVFEGSGFDIACAESKSPILYKLNNKNVLIKKIDFFPVFHENLFFVHLNKKQNTNESINFFFKKKFQKSIIDKLTKLTYDFIECEKLEKFQKCIIKHENIISEALHLKTIKEDLFKDYNGEIKSLGAWGGDFILAAGSNSTIEYFNRKGYHTVLKYKEIFDF